MKLNYSHLFFLCTAFVLTSCGDKMKSSDVEAINSKIDSSYNQISDLSIEQLKIYNQRFENPKITGAIEEYSKAKTISDKRKISDMIGDIRKSDPTDGRPHGDVNTIKSASYIDFISLLDKFNPQNFDLAIQNNDVVAKQIKLMNNYFSDIDKGTLDAVAFYEKLSKDDKTKLFFNTYQLKPLPDYAQKYIGREFQRAYLLQRLQIAEQLRQEFLRRRFINEFPQGFRQNTNIGLLKNEKQFDLSLTQK
jgi:hypothetical protein